MSNRPAGGAPSFNRPEFVRFDSLRDSKDLGPITDIKAHLSGFIGAEAGTQSLFFSFELLVPGAIQVQAITDSKWTQRFISVGLRSEAGSIGLDERGNARGVDIVNTASPDESLVPFPPGKYTVVVGCSQWQTTPFGLLLRVNPTTRLQAALTGRGGLGMGRSRLRVAVAKLEASLTGLGQLRAPGSGLFSGRRDKPLGSGFLTGEGALVGELSIREPLRSLAGGFLTGRGGFGASTLISNDLGPRMWVSRLATLTEAGGGTDSRAAISLTAFDYTLHVFYFLPAGSPSAQRRLALVYRAPNGQVLWSRLSDIFCLENDTEGWGLLTLPQGDFLLYSRSVGGFSSSPLGLYAMRIGLDGTVFWKRQLFAAYAANQVGITRISDAVWHPSLDRIIFTGVIGSIVPVYIILNPYTGAIDAVRGLGGGTLQLGYNFLEGGFATVNGPLIKADGRLVLTGAKRIATPAYTWTVECDANFSAVNTFYKYTDGTSLVFDGSAVLHFDSSVTIFSNSFNDIFLQLNPDLTIRRRVAAPSIGGFASQNQALLATDADGTLHLGGSSGLISRDYEGDISYRYMTYTGLPGRVDQGSTRRPGPWFKLSTRWAVLATSTAFNLPALGTLAVGFEIDMAPTTVSGLGYSITIGTSETVPQARQVLPPVVALDLDEVGGDITPLSFSTPGFQTSTATPAWNPTFIDASLVLTWELSASPIRRGISSGFPQLVVKPNPAVEPDPFAPFVSLHLPGSGIPDTNFFVDYSGFSQQATPLGNVKYSTLQARFPDIGGFFERTSIRFDGTDDAIAYPPSPGFRFGREAFTIEAWIYRLNTNDCILFSNSQLGDPAAHNNSFYLALGADGRLDIVAIGLSRLNFGAGGGVNRRAVPWAMWTHVGLSREDQVWRVYVGGQPDSVGWRFDLDLTAGALLIGRGPQMPTSWAFNFGNIGAGATHFAFTGFMADIRVTRGAARHHRSFQPRNAPIQYLPAGPPLSLPAGVEPPESGVATTDLAFNRVLLFARMNGNDNVFRDSGPYDHSLIPFGNVTQIPGGKWGGSQGTFDAFGDWMEVAANGTLSLGAGDYTVSLWATRTGEGQDPDFFQALLDSRSTEPEPQFCLRINRFATGRQLCLYVGGVIRILGQPMAPNVRYHIAVVRRAGLTTLFMNGVPVGASWPDTTDYTSTNWTIGRARLAAGADQWYFQGRLNDVRIERGAVYSGSFTPPVAPIGTPPSATARFWRLVDLRPFQGTGGVFAFSEIALHQGRNRLPNTVTTSLPAPSSGSLASTQDLSTTLNCSWDRSTMEQIGSWIQIDAGVPVTADSLRLATAGQTSQGVSGLTLQYSDNPASWTTLGHVAEIPPTEAALGPRLGFMPLPEAPPGVNDPNFSQVVLFLRGNEPDSAVLDSGPRGLAVENVNVSKSTVESIQGGQSLLFSAASNAYLTLGATGGDTQRRSVFFSFGTGALTIEMDIFPLTIPITNFSLYSTNPIGNPAAYTDGFQWVLTGQMKLDLFINGSFRGVSLASVNLRQWNRLRLSRDAAGLWRYTINGVVDATTFTNAVDISSRGFTIGRDGANTGAPWFYNGYMDEIRVTRGLARDNVIRLTNLAWNGVARGRLVATMTTSQTLRSTQLGRGRLAADLATIANTNLQGRLRGEGALEATLNTVRVLTLTTALAGRGGISGTLGVVRRADLAANLTGAGALAATLAVTRVSDLETALTGRGRLTASLSIATLRALQVVLDGAGDLEVSLDVTQVANLGAVLAAEGALAAELRTATLRNLEAFLDGAGGLSGELDAANSFSVVTSGRLLSEVYAVGIVSPFLVTLAPDRLAAGTALATALG